MRKEIKIAIICSLTVLIAIVAVRIYFYYTHWTMKEVHDASIVPININIDSVKKGLPFADKRVLEWRKDAVLASITAIFQGKEEISKRKGLISYKYLVENNDGIGWPQAVGYVDIDMGKNAITKFFTLSGERLGGYNIDVPNSDITFNEIFDLVEKKCGTEIFDRYSNPRVMIRCGNKGWDMDIYPSDWSGEEDIVITFDPDKKEILKFDELYKRRK